MNKIKNRIEKVVQEHPIESFVAVVAIGHTVGFLAGHYLAKGIVKAATNGRIF